MKKRLVLYLVVAVLMVLTRSRVMSRPLEDSTSSDDQLVSDGVELDDIGIEEENTSSSGLKGRLPESCEQMYGIVPCSDSIGGQVFLIVVFEYLLFHGESYVAGGGQRIFKILGPGVFGACAFQLIGALPESLILLISGLVNNKEVAEECVLTGVGLLAGSSILLLTLVWGTCVLLGTKHFPDYINSQPSHSTATHNNNPLERFFLSLWPGYGVVTDSWSGYTARIMLVSIIPFTIIQFPGLLRLSHSWERIFMLVALFVSLAFLLSYFFYQLFQPWIQGRQLLYLKHGHLAVDILKHVEDRTMGRLFTDDGAPDLSVIQSIFKETDQDGDKSLSAAELKAFLQEIKFRKLYSDKDKATLDMMKEFDMDSDKKININEFVKGMEKWIEETKNESSRAYGLDEVLRPWMEKKREEREVMTNLIPEILEHLQSSIQGSLLTQDGTPDVAAIKRLFRDTDHDQDDFISHSELRELMMDIKFGSVSNDTVSQMMEELDISGDQLISEDEFVTGLSKWLNQTAKPDRRNDSDYHKSWEETDKLVESNAMIDKSLVAWAKAISLVVLGIVMLGLLAEPLIHSVQSLSKSANVSSFFISFIFVPLATNARIAISAIGEVRRKKVNINSLTFSEIYGTVLMNNLLGFSVLLSLIYFRGLSWDFSVEVLMVLIVSGVMGCVASFSAVFPVWTAVFAYLLYPLSLVLVTVLGHFNWLS